MTFVSGTLDSNGGGADENDAKDGRLVATYDVAPPLTHNPHGDHESREGILVSGSIGASAGKQRGAGIAPETLVAAYGGNRQSGPLDVATACNAKGGTGRSDFESETFVVQPTAFNWQSGGNTGVTLDANEEHTGALQANQVPAIAFVVRGREGGSAAEVAKDGLANALRTPGGGSSHQMVAIGLDSQLNPGEEISGPLNITSASGGGHPAMVATREVAQSLTSNYGKHSDNSDTALGPTLAISFAQNQRGEVRTSDRNPTLGCGGGKPGQWYPAALIGSRVRRLSPTECERLQGFSRQDPETGEWSDGHTCLCGKNRGRSVAPYGEESCSCADGPRYRACGNSVVVPGVEWVLGHVARATVGAGDHWLRQAPRCSILLVTGVSRQA